MKLFPIVLSIRSLFYIVLTGALSVLAKNLFFENTLSELNGLLKLIFIVSLGQCVLSFQEEIKSKHLIPLFLADILITAQIVRATGSSTSPFLVLFPLVSLTTAVIFEFRWSLIVVTVCATALFWCVGYGVSLVGNILAVVVTGVLGAYLNRALFKSEQELKVSERARRRLENLQKAILRNIPSGLMSVDSDGKIIQINEPGIKILGMTETDVLATRVKDIIPEFSFAQVENPQARPTVLYKSPIGKEVRLGYSLAELADVEEKQSLGTLIVFQDLTEILKMEESLRMSEKLAAVGKLAAAIAHEIRNPLAGISGSAQLLATLKDLSEEDTKLLSIIQKESQKLDELITEFLEYVRPAKAKMDPVSLRALVDEQVDALSLNQKWKSYACQILVRSPDKDVLVFGEGNKISQTLLNLILNAGQAGAKKVEIRIHSHGRLDVCDNGPGISEENLNRIFEPFFTTKEEGTGLGLATSFRHMESMEAMMRVRSPVPEISPKGGTMFSIEFKKVQET